MKSRWRVVLGALCAVGMLLICLMVLRATGVRKVSLGVTRHDAVALNDKHQVVEHDGETSNVLVVEAETSFHTIEGQSLRKPVSALQPAASQTDVEREKKARGAFLMSEVNGALAAQNMSIEEAQGVREGMRAQLLAQGISEFEVDGWIATDGMK